MSPTRQKAREALEKLRDRGGVLEVKADITDEIRYFDFRDEPFQVRSGIGGSPIFYEMDELVALIDEHAEAIELVEEASNT